MHQNQRRVKETDRTIEGTERKRERERRRRRREEKKDGWKKDEREEKKVIAKKKVARWENEAGGEEGDMNELVE